MLRLGAIAFAVAVLASIAVPSFPLARAARLPASALLVALLFVHAGPGGRARIRVVGWCAVAFAIAWASTGRGAPAIGALVVAIGFALFIRRPLAPWMETRPSGWLRLFALAAFAPLAVLLAAGSGAAVRDNALIRLDRALYTLSVSWIFLSARLAVGELLHRWIRRARIRTKLLVAFGIFAVTPALLAFAYAALAGWIHAGSLRASVIERQLEANSGGRALIRRALQDPAPSSGAELAARIGRERPVLVDRGLAAVALERRPEGWRTIESYGDPDSLFRPAAAPVADSGEVVHGLMYRNRRFWWAETALWPRGGDTLALQTFEPVDTTRVSRLARDLGCDAVLMTSSTMFSGETKVTVGSKPRNQRHFRTAGGLVEIGTDQPLPDSISDSAAIDSLSSLGGLALVGGGAYAPATSLKQIRKTSNGGSTPPCYLWNGGGWHRGAALLLVHSPAGESFQYSGMDLGPFATAARIALIVFAMIFISLEIVSLAVGSRVARFITRGAAGLRQAAASIGQGDFSARVQVPSEDELGELADSFNRMAAGLQEGQRAVVEREQMRRELELARRIQSRLLPPGPPSLPRLDVAAANAMSQQVGGDYYDFISLEDGHMGFCIADVAGKGVAAALLMSSVKTALVSSAAVETAPHLLTGRVNRLLEQSIEPGRFVTFFLASLDPATMRLEYVNAGHPAPMLVRAAGGVERLEMGGIILGIDAAAKFEAGSVTLAPGDLLAMFTDGVTEAQGADEELFGDARIESVLHLNRERTAEEVLNALIEAVKRYEGVRGPSDDLTAVVVKVER
ncbi:MAG TPA: SpoIIE family protein phosphatase [Candidatus Omnitrophota bacterium]|nr:SpoIIE family protein phosphatase [Candidatus Omnitrophota bacterium]